MNAEQRMAALDTANQRRVQAGALRREVTAGTITLAEAIADPRAGVLKVSTLLGAQRGWGERTVRAELSGTFIRPDKRIRDLTDRQLHILEGLDRRQVAA